MVYDTTPLSRFVIPTIFCSSYNSPIASPIYPILSFSSHSLIFPPWYSFSSCSSLIVSKFLCLKGCNCQKLCLDLSPQILGLFQWSKLHWKALKKTFPMMLESSWHLKNPPRDQLISSHWTLNHLYLRNWWSWAFTFDSIIKLSSRQSHWL